jgi:hypothetical protein
LVVGGVVTGCGVGWLRWEIGDVEMGRERRKEKIK